MSKKNPIKVAIIIEKGHYDKSHKSGVEFTSVEYNTSTYGAASPCDTKEEVEDAIKRHKKSIIEMGDIPVIDNQIAKRTLFDFK